MRQQANGGKHFPPHRTQSPRVRSRIRSWLLLYWPSRNRAWLYRLPFYFLAFFVIPLLSFAALGAYIGRDDAWAWVDVLLFAFLAIVVRVYAVRADATLGKSEAFAAWHRISEAWPFPLEDPPPRRPLYGYMASAGGTALILFGIGGMGLVANGLVWLIVLLSGILIVLLSGIETNLEEMPSVFVIIVIIVGCISAIIIGLLGVVGFSAGVRLRDRGRRLQARDARTLLQRPGERPVLLLRSFDDEALVDPRPMNLFQRRYEESLSRVLKQLGPVITVGRPGEPMGFAGAARFYVSEDNWQRAIRYLMAHSAAVVIIVGRTQGLWWEIGTAFECVAREHLLFFFPLVGTVPRNPSPFAGFKSFYKRWNAIGYKEMEIEHRARYQLFRQRSVQYLGQSLPVELKNAFFLDFLPDGQARVLHSRYGLLEYLWAGGFNFFQRFRRPRFNMMRTLWPFMAKLYKAI